MKACGYMFELHMSVCVEQTRSYDDCSGPVSDQGTSPTTRQSNTDQCGYNYNTVKLLSDSKLQICTT